ncbi:MULTISPECIES: S8 family peptidase [unclassified Streptomyces]|uniref:S8 family peptidase n=1 Tax=Streptomyces sp. NPDC023588 TaxID=3154907 RepID=UPI0033C68B36
MPVMRHTRRKTAGISATAVVALALGAAAALPASAADIGVRGVIENAGAPGSVPGSYIVTLKDTAARSTAPSGKAVARRYGAKIDRTYSAALNGYSVVASEAQATRLAADPAVKSVVQNRIFSVNSTQPTPPSWGLDRADQRTLPLNQSYTYPDQAGQGVTAYVIDTGIRITHQDFGGRASYGYDAIDNDMTAQDGHGHGTHVAGTVAGGSYGVAKKAKVVGVRVLDNDGYGTTAQVVAGIDWVTKNAVKPAVANMSLGGGADTALDNAVRNSIASGITYAVAAGNDGTSASKKSPARVTEAITVGATTSTDARAAYSNYGPVLDVFAPGSGITSAWGTGDTATNTINGTSMATPHVAGAAAVYLSQNPASTPAQVASALLNSATPDRVTNAGTGSPNRLLHVGVLGPVPPGKRFDNTTDYAINDHATTESPIAVSGVVGNAPQTLKVPLDIKHSYIGDLKVDLIAPDGTVYTLHNRANGGDDNIVRTFTVDASARAANGVWKLRVNDGADGDTGKIDSWALQF